MSDSLGTGGTGAYETLDEGAGTWTQVLWKSGVCSSLWFFAGFVF